MFKLCHIICKQEAVSVTLETRIMAIQQLVVRLFTRVELSSRSYLFTIVVVTDQDCGCSIVDRLSRVKAMLALGFFSKKIDLTFLLRETLV